MPTPYQLGRKTPLFTPNADFVGSYGNNGRITARIPVGPTYLSQQYLFTIAGGLATAAQISAQVALVRFLVDAEAKIELTGAELVALAEFYRPNCVGNGIVPMIFARPWQEIIENQDGPAYGTVGIDTVTVEVIFAASGVTIDRAQLWSETIDAEPLGAHLVTVKQNYQFASTGTQEITDLPRNPNYRLYALHITPPTGATAVLTNVELVADNVREIFGSPSQLHMRYRLQANPRVPQATWPLQLDFAHRGRHLDSLPLVMQDLRLRLTWGTAAPTSFNIIMEQYRVAMDKGA